MLATGGSGMNTDDWVMVGVIVGIVFLVLGFVWLRDRRVNDLLWRLQKISRETGGGAYLWVNEDGTMVVAVGRRTWTKNGHVRAAALSHRVLDGPYGHEQAYRLTSECAHDRDLNHVLDGAEYALTEIRRTRCVANVHDELFGEPK